MGNCHRCFEPATFHFCAELEEGLHYEARCTEHTPDFGRGVMRSGDVPYKWHEITANEYTVGNIMTT